MPTIQDEERLLMLNFIRKYDLWKFVHGRTIWEKLATHQVLQARNIGHHTLKNHYERYMVKKIKGMRLSPLVEQMFRASILPREDYEGHFRILKDHPALRHSFYDDPLGYFGPRYEY